MKRRKASKWQQPHQKRKFERAYTVKDIESDDLECVMINRLNMDIYSIDDSDMSDRIKVPVGAQLDQSWAKGAELEKAFSKHSVTPSAEIEKLQLKLKRVLKKLSPTLFRNM